MKSVLASLDHYPAAGLVGARQTGKTTLAREIAGTNPEGAAYLDLELPSDLAKLSDPEGYLGMRAASLVIIDEIHRKPELFPVLRALIDVQRRNGRFLILGSASPQLLRQASESLAGRIIYHEMHPLVLSETGVSHEGINRLWLRGGFPNSFLAESDEIALQWRETFIQAYLERDIPGYGLRIPAATLRNFCMMLAHNHGQLWNASKIAGSLGQTAPTIQHYLNIFYDTFMARELKPYFVNLKKRLVKSPKVYLRDSGILHALLKIETQEDLAGHPVAGASWEGWVIEQVMSLIPPRWEPFFYRTSAGAEIDLLIEGPAHKGLLAFEIKLSTEPKPSRGFWSALEDLKPARAYVVHPGKEFYPLAENVFALPVLELKRILE